MTTYIKITLIIYGIIIISFWVYWKLREWREDRIFWKQFKIKLKKQDEEFYERLFELLKKDQSLKDIMVNLHARMVADRFVQAFILDEPGWDTPVPDKKKLTDRIKQFVIDIF